MSRVNDPMYDSNYKNMINQNTTTVATTNTNVTITMTNTNI